MGPELLHKKLKERTGDNTLPIYSLIQAVQFAELHKAVRAFPVYSKYQFGGVKLTILGRMGIISDPKLLNKSESQAQPVHNIIERAENVFIAQVKNSRDISIRADQKTIKTLNHQSWKDIETKVEKSDLVPDFIKKEAIEKLAILEEESLKPAKDEEKIHSALTYLQSKLPGELWVLVQNVGAIYLYDVLRNYLASSKLF